MRDAISKVAEFNHKHGVEFGDPDSPGFLNVDLRLGLIGEELIELSDAVEAGDIVAAADAIADSIYVLIGAAIVWGINLEAVFAEVHRSNMTKTPGNLSPNGKILKGPGYSPPDVAGALKLPVNWIRR